jgi:hypothetical protein
VTRSETLASYIADADLTDVELVDLIGRIVPRLGTSGLSRLGVVWWRAVERAAKVSPDVAHDLVRAQHAMLSAFRPETPCNLDAGFVPTEPVPSTPPMATSGGPDEAVSGGPDEGPTP